MKLEKIEIGVHTVELYALNLKYQQVQKVIDRLVDCGPVQVVKSDPYHIDRHLKCQQLVDQGIRLRLYQSYKHSNGIGIIVNPSTLVQGSYQPTRLFVPKKRVDEKFLNGIESVLNAMGMAELAADGEEGMITPDQLSLSQMDLTANLWFSDEADITELIRLFWKSKVPKSFKRKSKLKREERQHFFCMSNGTVTVKAYDKIFELEKNERCPQKLRGKKLLRLEVSLKREAFIDKLGLERKDSCMKMIRAGARRAEEILLSYLYKLFPCSGKYVRYSQAMEQVQKRAEDTILQEQMCYLVKKTSDGAGLDTAIQKLKIHYKDVGSKGVKKLLREFDRLGINPITLPNSSQYQQLPPLIDLWRES